MSTNRRRRKPWAILDEEFGQQTQEERSKVAGAIMMYQKTLVTRFSGKEFLTPEGTNADLTKKGLRPPLYELPIFVGGYERRPDEEGIETPIDILKNRMLGYERRPDEEGIETFGECVPDVGPTVRTQT